MEKGKTQLRRSRGPGMTAHTPFAFLQNIMPAPFISEKKEAKIANIAASIFKISRGACL